jgi:hypothetical protein
MSIRDLSLGDKLLRVSCCSHEAGRVSYMHVPLVKDQLSV